MLHHHGDLVLTASVSHSQEVSEIAPWDVPRDQGDAHAQLLIS